jgi:hypothetical protein
VDCFNLTQGFERCYRCTTCARHLDVIVPISYSIAHASLHQALAGYKRGPETTARHLTRELAAVLWRFLDEHESCVARAAGTERFEIVTTVPSGDRGRDEHHPLREIVGGLVAPTRARHERLLTRSAVAVPPRTWDARKYEPIRGLGGEAVLLIDDTMTSGASAQNAAAALRRAGAARVAAVVIGRHVNRGWGDNDRRLGEIAPPFDWSRCAVCRGGAEPSGRLVQDQAA